MSAYKSALAKVAEPQSRLVRGRRGVGGTLIAILKNVWVQVHANVLTRNRTKLLRGLDYLQRMIQFARKLQDGVELCLRVDSSFLTTPLISNAAELHTVSASPISARGKLLGFNRNDTTLQGKSKGKRCVVSKVRPTLKFFPPPFSPAAKWGRT